jgi:hypothetical protein
VLLIKQCERNSKQLNFILNQINVIIPSYQHSMKKYLPGVFKFYQLKATGGGFLIFEWTLVFCYCLRSISGNFLTYFYVRKLVLKFETTIMGPLCISGRYYSIYGI